MKGTPKDLTILIRKAEKQGWRIIRRRNNHLKWTSPEGSCVWSSGTPSDINAVAQIQRNLRVYGYKENA
jgi:N-acetyl-anhydromuramyl-L-alanine amidase AmpD